MTTRNTPIMKGLMTINKCGTEKESIKITAFFFSWVFMLKLWNVVDFPITAASALWSEEKDPGGYYPKLGDPSVDIGCCLFTLGRYRYESTWYSIAHCCVPHLTKWKAFGNFKKMRSRLHRKREWLYRCKVLLLNAFNFVEWAFFKDIGSV